MAKKKNISKKHKFKHVEPALSSATAQNIAGQASAGSMGGGGKKPAVAVGTSRDFSYVAGDVRRIAVLAACLIVLELALWYLFSYTSFGSGVYKSIAL